jgi:AraC-like DNA-binding protein
MKTDTRNKLKTKKVFDRKRSNQWEFTVLDSNTVYLKETITVRGRSFFMDVTNELWVFSLLSVDAADVFFRTHSGEIIIPPGEYGFFKPPFSITEIGAENKQVTLTAILSRVPLPDGIPEAPTLFRLRRNVLPENYSDLFSLLCTAPVQNGIARYDSEHVAGIALKAKNSIDTQYREPLPIGAIAEKIGISSNLFSMYFKKAFHLTPSEYRKQLRIKSSVFQLLDSSYEKRSVTDIAFNCGYNDLSRYNKQFKSYTGVTPRQVKI